MPFFSLLCPTRERPIQRENLIKSIIDTTSNLNNVELLFAADKDDLATQDNVINLIKKYNQLKIRVFVRNRSIFLNRDYYNWLAGFADGDFYWVIGDDVIFRFKGWDSYIQRRIEDYLIDKKDRIICVGASDDTPKPNDSLPHFPCFPILSKEAVRAMGYVLPPEIPTWGADYIIYELYRRVGRLLIISEYIFLSHISYHTKKVPEDKISKRVGEIFNALKMRKEYSTDVYLREKLPLQVEYLKNVIKGVIKIHD